MVEGYSQPRNAEDSWAPAGLFCVVLCLILHLIINICWWRLVVVNTFIGKVISSQLAGGNRLVHV